MVDWTRQIVIVRICDYLTQYITVSAVASVFVPMEIDSGRIVHVNVTANPTHAWVHQQIREATTQGVTSPAQR